MSYKDRQIGAFTLGLTIFSKYSCPTKKKSTTIILMMLQAVSSRKSIKRCYVRVSAQLLVKGKVRWNFTYISLALKLTRGMYYTTFTSTIVIS